MEQDMTKEGTVKKRKKVSSSKPYTQEEDDFIRRVYPDYKNYTIEEIAAAMDNRSASGVAKRAGALGVKRPNNPYTVNAHLGVRTCTHCKEELPFSEFTKNRSKPYGIEAICMQCQKLVRRIKREESRKKELMQKFIDNNPNRTCSRCGEVFETNEENFAWMVSTNRFDTYCRKCSSERTKEYMEKNLKEKGYRK